ncbi:histidine kinase [Lachnospiraceae bacterium ZAX-1]
MKAQDKMYHGLKSLNNRLIAFIVLCWAAPISAFFMFMVASYQKDIISKNETMAEEQVSRVAEIAAMRIDEAIYLAQKPTYERDWENAFYKYKKGNISQMGFLQALDKNIRLKFYVDSRFCLYAYYQKDVMEPGIYSCRVGNSYENYMQTIHDKVQEVIDSETNYPVVKVINERIFIIRNLYTTTDYKQFGTLVVEMDKQKIFHNIQQKVQEQVVVCIENSESILSFLDSNSDKNRTKLVDALLLCFPKEESGSIIKEQNKDYNGYLYQKDCEKYDLGIIFLVERREIYASLYNLYSIAGLMILSFIPDIFIGASFLRKQIRVPVARLVEGAKAIEEGNFGIVLEGDPMPNLEFQYLTDSFNNMSLQLKYLFEYIYDEKLATKDAQIAALQAQINPHFINNTLEMMNWQARMSGDFTVSKMIGALGTVLDYRMNRTNITEIHLSEEMRCADAYLYVMSMRFGQRLQIEKDIDKDLLAVNVPPLILQPLLENAIVHGVESIKNGNIKIKVYHDESQIYIEVRNSGKLLSEEELENIKNLLEGDEEKILKGVGKHTSIGIRNVNQRIKLVYGINYGFTIVQEAGNITVSCITLPYEKGEGQE